jgi:hypothetical protein
MLIQNCALCGNLRENFELRLGDFNTSGGFSNRAKTRIVSRFLSRKLEGRSRAAVKSEDW